jgi:hypothetical protein
MRYVRRLSVDTQQKAIVFALVEAILILISAKIISLLYTLQLGWATLRQEVLSWGIDFFDNFANPDFLLRAFCLLVIWLITWLFSLPLNKLEEDERLMAQEKLGYTFTDRPRARRNLIALVFNLGIVMIILMVLQNNDRIVLPVAPTSPMILVVVLLVYFCTAFLFLAFNQYAIMKARWYFNDIKVNPNLAKHWVLFSVFFIFVILLLIVFLPTNFTLEISLLARWVSDAFFAVISFLYSIVIAPFVLVMILIQMLFNDVSDGDTIERVTPEPPVIRPGEFTGIPWWDVITAIASWLVFIAVMVIAIRYYLINNPSLKQFFIDLKFIGWLKNFWKWFIQFFKQAHHATAETIQTGLSKIQSLLRSQKTKTSAVMKLAKRLPARQAVILIYIDWIHWNRKVGLFRLPSQTPMEYAHSYHQFFQDGIELDETVDKLTAAFMMARYSRQPVEKNQVLEVQQWTRSLKENFPNQAHPMESQP